MTKILTSDEMKNYRKYHIPGCSQIHRIKINALFIHSGNTYTHESYKFATAWQILQKGHKFICEACPNKSDRRVDIVDITSGIEYEIETDPKRAERFKNMEGVEVVKAWKDQSVQTVKTE